MALPSNWELILCFAPHSSLVGLFFPFLKWIFLTFGSLPKCLHIKVPSSSTSKTITVLARSGRSWKSGEGWIMKQRWATDSDTHSDSVSSLGGQVRDRVLEYSDLVFYLDVLISSCLQALSCDNPDVWRDSCSLQYTKNKQQKTSPTPFLGTGLCKAWLAWGFFFISRQRPCILHRKRVVTFQYTECNAQSAILRVNHGEIFPAKTLLCADWTTALVKPPTPHPV